MIPWDELIARAEQVCCPRSLSFSSEAGAVAAAILTDRGNFVTPVSALTPPAPWASAPSTQRLRQ